MKKVLPTTTTFYFTNIMKRLEIILKSYQTTLGFGDIPGWFASCQCKRNTINGGGELKMVIIIISMNRQVNPTIAERMAVLEKTCRGYT